MIKTVSFAPPRSARAASKSSSKAAPAQPARAIEAASGSAALSSKPAKTRLAPPASGSSAKSAAIAEAAPVVPARRRAAVEKPAVNARVTRVASADAAMIEAEIVEPEVAAPARKAPAKRAARKSSDADVALDFGVETAAKVEAEVKDPVEAARVVAPRIKRSRAPKDLAAQYGAAPETDVAPRVVAEKNVPRKRLTRAAKEARSQMLRPDDDVLQRLQQANAVEVKKPASRGRGWEFECGCCGRTTRFQTPAAICECGAIAVKE